LDKRPWAQLYREKQQNVYSGYQFYKQKVQEARRKKASYTRRKNGKKYTS